MDIIAFLVNKEKLNKKRGILLATLWLFWGIFGTIFWDTIKKNWRMKNWGGLTLCCFFVTFLMAHHLSLKTN